MSETIIIVGAVLYWTFAVVALVALDRVCVSAFERTAVSVFWPISAVLGILVIMANLPFRTVKNIRIRLENRGLLREFDAWIAAKKAAEKGRK